MGVGAGLHMYDVVVEKSTFAISSPDEFLLKQEGAGSAYRCATSQKALRVIHTAVLPSHVSRGNASIRAWYFYPNNWKKLRVDFHEISGTRRLWTTEELVKCWK